MMNEESIWYIMEAAKDASWNELQGLLGQVYGACVASFNAVL